MPFFGLCWPRRGKRWLRRAQSHPMPLKRLPWIKPCLHGFMVPSRKRSGREGFDSALLGISLAMESPPQRDLSRVEP